jgi:hypothetical protein
MTRDRISGAILIAFAFAVVWESRNFPIGTMQRPGPGYVPILLVVGLGMAGLIILACGGKSPGLRSIQWPEWRHAAAILTACVFMALLLESLGYRITIALMLAFLIRVIERRGIVLTLTVALGASFGTYWLFNDVLRVLLPQGMLGF